MVDHEIQCQGLVEQGNGMVKKLLGVQLHEATDGSDYLPWLEWLPLIQCKDSSDLKVLL